MQNAKLTRAPQGKKFVFKGYDADIKKGEVFFHFSLHLPEKNIDFTERISSPPVNNNISSDLLKSILNNLMLILGISYWKLYCPEVLEIKSFKLSKEQAQFWNTVYTKGLGEFFYKNKIDFRGLVKFPYEENVFPEAITFPRKDRALLGLGGGKDSIVSSEMLKNQNKSFDVFTVGTSQIQEDVANAMNKKPIAIKRELDPKLFELNKQKETYKGHVPISAIYAFLGLFTSTLYDYNSVIVGNEKSANYGNVEYLGEMINHQWSKSKEFEQLFKEYVQKFITPDISYSSILRDLNEVEITREFIKYPQYFKVFSSCNNNFKILRSAQDDNNRWCGKCAKCLFVFILLSAFLPKQEVLNIFGKNLFEDEGLLPLFKELLGLKDIKPFECVGTPEEMRLALSKIAKKKEFKKNFLISHTF